MLIVPYWLALKAEALHLADRVPEALDAVREAEALAETSGEPWWSAELHRLRGVFLVTLGADDAEIEAALCEAIRTAKAQNSRSLTTRAEATYAEYRARKRRVKASKGGSQPANVLVRHDSEFSPRIQVTKRVGPQHQALARADE